MTNITFGTYAKPATSAKADEYTPYVQQLISATDDWAAAGFVGDQPSMTETVDADVAESIRFAIQAAARSLGKTARIVGYDTSATSVIGKDDKGGDVLTGPVSITVIVTAKHKARRGAKATQDGTPAPSEPSAELEAPEDAPAA